MNGHRFDALVFPEHAENADYELCEREPPQRTPPPHNATKDATNGEF
jgi:hypothetical protein